MHSCDQAAGVVRPLVSTVVATDMNGNLSQSLDRSKYRASEMPQAFKYAVIKNAYEKVYFYMFACVYFCFYVSLVIENFRLTS